MEQVAMWVVVVIHAALDQALREFLPRDHINSYGKDALSLLCECLTCRLVIESLVLLCLFYSLRVRACVLKWRYRKRRYYSHIAVSKCNIFCVYKKPKISPFLTVKL